MHMKRSDIWWAVAYGLLAVFTVLFCVTGGFAKVNIAYPYLAGFAQFAVYATAGELLSGRMLEGTWQINRATWFKSLSWGIGGVLVTLAFTVFSQPNILRFSPKLPGKPWQQVFFRDMEMLWHRPFLPALPIICFLLLFIPL